MLDLSSLHNRATSVQVLAAPAAGKRRSLLPTSAKVVPIADSSGLEFDEKPSSIVGNAGGAEQLDLSRWDDDDVDLREIIERLEHHRSAIE